MGVVIDVQPNVTVVVVLMRVRVLVVGAWMSSGGQGTVGGGSRSGWLVGFLLVVVLFALVADLCCLGKEWHLSLLVGEAGCGFGAAVAIVEILECDFFFGKLIAS